MVFGTVVIAATRSASRRVGGPGIAGQNPEQSEDECGALHAANGDACRLKINLRRYRCPDAGWVALTVVMAG